MTPVKIRGGVDEISGSLVVVAPMTEPGIHLLAGLAAGAESRRRVKIKTEKNSTVKLKAVPTESGCLKILGTGAHPPLQALPPG